MLSSILHRISQLSLMFIALWPILLVFALGASEPIAFGCNMVRLLGYSLVTWFVSTFLSMVL